jgi:hypothetical protein
VNFSGWQGNRMKLLKRVIKQSSIVIIPLALLSLLVDWKDEHLKFMRLFGNPAFVPISIIIGGIMGIANLKGLVWGTENLLGTTKANAKLIFLSLFRLLVFFTAIIILTFLKLINLLGFVAGLTVVFLILIKEGMRMAQDQAKE